MKKLLALIAPILAVVCLTACKATLEPGGAYAPVDTNNVPIIQPDLAFYSVDATYDLAYSAIDAAFKFERDNRLLIWHISPDFKHAMDAIRPKAEAANRQYLLARATYLANPVPSGLSDLQSLLAKIQQLSGAATAALPH